MYITVNPVVAAIQPAVVYRGAVGFGPRGLLKTTRSLGRSLNLYPSTTRYTATTGSITLEFDNQRRNVQGMFELSPRAKVEIYDREGGIIIWSGDGYAFDDLPTERKCVLRVRDAVERLAGLRLAPPIPSDVQVGLRAYMGEAAQTFLGYDLFAAVAGDPDIMVFPPTEDVNALEFLERVLPLLSAAHRYYIANIDGRIEVLPLRARNSGVVIREVIGDYRASDGRDQVWNQLQFETPDRKGKFLGKRNIDFTLVPSSQAQFGVRQLALNFKHLTAAQGAEVAEAVLYTALFPRRRVRLTTPATQPLALLDVVNIELRTQGASLVRLAGRWVVNELAFDLYTETYKLELIQHLAGDPIDA